MKHSTAAVEGECELEKLRGDEAGKDINNYLLVCYSVKYYNTTVNVLCTSYLIFTTAL